MLIQRLLTAAAAAALLAAAPSAFAQATAPAPVAPAPAAAPAMATPVVANGDLVTTIKASGQFTILLKAVDATNLTPVLSKYPNLTLLAPTDAAFAKLPPGELDRLMANKTALQKLLTHHIINARIDSSKIKGVRGPVPSVATDNIVLDGSTDVLKVDNATIIQADVMASNGILHVVDQVLKAGSVPEVLPEEVAEPATPAATTTTTTTTTTKK